MYSIRVDGGDVNDALSFECAFETVDVAALYEFGSARSESRPMQMSTRQHARERVDMVSRDTARESVDADNAASSASPPRRLSLSPSHHGHV